MSSLEEIKSKLDIVDIISESVQLKQFGANWKGLCPFHVEKTPSFVVSKDKQIWHCFGCNEGGDLFGWFIKKEGLEFIEALKILSEKAGVALTYTDVDKKAQSKKHLLIELCESAALIWHNALLDLDDHNAVVDYLHKRGVGADCIQEWRLGFAPDSYNFLLKQLINKGYKFADIEEAGLIVRKTVVSKTGDNYYDYFRNRIMYPIKDIHGRTIGFGSRAISDDKSEAKYINTKETLIYRKREVLYGIEKSKDYIRKANLAIIVEGYMDVISVFNTQTKNVVACSGTALTLEQIQLLKRYTHNIVLAFDADSAGAKATMLGIDLLLKEGLNIKIVTLPGDQHFKDPDECVRYDGGALWERAVANSINIMDYYFNIYLSGKDLKNIDHKRVAAANLIPLIAKITDPISKDYYLQKLSHMLLVDESILRGMLSNAKSTIVKTVTNNVSSKPDRIDVPLKQNSRQFALEERLLALMLRYPKNIKYIIENVGIEIFNDLELAGLYKYLVIYYTKMAGTSNDNPLSVDSFLFWTKDEIKNATSAELSESSDLAQKVNILLLLAETEYVGFNDMLLEGEALKLVKYLKHGHLVKRLKEIEKEISLIESVDTRGEKQDSVSAEVEESLKKLSLEYQSLSCQIKQ